MINHCQRPGIMPSPVLGHGHKLMLSGHFGRDWLAVQLGI